VAGDFGRHAVAPFASMLVAGLGQAIKGRWRAAALAALGVYGLAFGAYMFRDIIWVAAIMSAVSAAFYARQIRDALRDDPPK
jgi:hypothetical protein